MKTTIEIPDELFKEVKATAALRGESLKEFISGSLRMRLSKANRPQSDRSGWRSVFGLAEPKAVKRIDRLISEQFEQTDPSEWR